MKSLSCAMAWTKHLIAICFQCNLDALLVQNNDHIGLKRNSEFELCQVNGGGGKLETTNPYAKKWNMCNMKTVKSSKQIFPVHIDWIVDIKMFSMRIVDRSKKSIPKFQKS